MLLSVIVSFIYIVDINNSDSWVENDGEGVVVGEILRHEGIWNKCATDPGGTSCEGLEKFWVDLPTPIVYGRFLIYASMIGCALASICYFLGLNVLTFLALESVSGVSGYSWDYCVVLRNK